MPSENSSSPVRQQVIPPTPGTCTSTMSGPQCAICMSALVDGKVLEPCEHAICKSCFGTWAQTCRCAIPGVPPECVHCSTGFVECPFCRELTTHPAEAHNDQRKRKIERDQRHALRRARERAQAEQRAGGYVSKNFKITKNREGTIGVRFRGKEITDVLAGTPAHTAGLRVGMRFVKIEGTVVQDHSDAVHDALKAAPNTFSLTIDVPRISTEAARERADAGARNQVRNPVRNHQNQHQHQQHHQHQHQQQYRNHVQPQARDVERERLREREREREREHQRQREQERELQRLKERENERARAIAQNRPEHLRELRMKVEKEREKEKERMQAAMGFQHQLRDYRHNHRDMWHHMPNRGGRPFEHNIHGHGRMPYGAVQTHRHYGHHARVPHPLMP